MSFDVVVDDLGGHASHLAGLMDRLATAVDAANTVSMDESGYGLLCSFLPPLVNGMGEKGVDALRAATEAMDATAADIRTTVDLYLRSDEANAQPFRATLATHDD